METQEYFIPKLEDLRIGYEYEEYWFRITDADTWNAFHFEKLEKGQFIKEEKWLKHKITEPLMYGGTLSDKINSGTLRVPYLSKRDIQQEGWEILKKSDNNYIYAKKGISELRYDMGHYTLAVYNTIDPTNELIKYPAYYGACKCKNTFRYLMDLLNI